MHVLENLAVYYRDTIKSVMWVDSSERNYKSMNCIDDNSWIFLNLPTVNDYPDPLILIAWQCKKLEEIVLYGYKYRIENLIAICRLRGEHLKKLEIAEQDILKHDQYNFTVRECFMFIKFLLRFVVFFFFKGYTKKYE